MDNSSETPENEGIDVSLITQFFHPDTSANSTILTELAEGLASRDVNLSVVTTQPSYASADRETDAPTYEIFRDILIYRVFAFRFDKNSGLIWRLLNEISFFISSILHLLTTKRNDDILLLPTAPPFLPILGWILKRTSGRRYVPIIYDLYPDMAVELDYISGDGVIYRVWNWLNTRAYRDADCIITIGETMEETIKDNYGSECDTVVIHNWEDGDFIQPKQKENNSFAKEHGLTNRTTILYSGNLGLHHDLESAVEAADELEETFSEDEFEFLFIGEGGKKQILKDMSEDRSLDTISFLPYQPKEALPNSLTCGDIALVTMEEGVEGLCVSSKFYTALASGQAVLAIANTDSEIGRIVDKAECGIRVDPNSPEQIVEAVSYWINNPDEAQRMGHKARELFESEYTMSHSVSKYHEVLQHISNNEG